MGAHAPAGASRRTLIARGAVAATLVAVTATLLTGVGVAEEVPAAPAVVEPLLPADAAGPRPTALPVAPPAADPAPETGESAAAPSATSDTATSDTATSETATSDTATPETAVPEAVTADPARSVPVRAAPRAAPQTAAPAAPAQPALVPATPCTATARACVDLVGRKAWLIDAGNVVRGPVEIMPGDRGDPTPRGIFAVQWKAEQYTSREYLTPMPYSVFFAAGGIAFHEGRQDTPSAGCVKLSHDDAAAWFAFLQIGDEVQIR